MAKLPDRLVNAWNAFLRPVDDFEPSIGVGYGYPPNRTILSGGNERSIVSALYNRIAVDVSTVDIEHCRVDDSDRFVEKIDSGLNNCLTLEANIDQSGRDFIQDLVLTMFDEGAVAVVPVDVDVSPINNNSYDILTMRVGRIVEWYPQDIRVDVYNDRTGQREQLLLPKRMTAVIQNPLYSIMNEPNSTLQRLIRKLNLLDAVDEQSSSGKLDLIIQLPYVIKSKAREQQAEARRKMIEDQLAGSKYGIAYTDGTERITQLNRSVENNLLNQVRYLTTMLYGQLGISEAIANGTANEQEMLNYQNRTLEPILSAICDGLRRTFLTKTARTQGQTIKYFQDPFRLVPVTTLAEIADKFTRNEIMSSNEFRGVLGYKKSDDPAADELRNSNLNRPTDSTGTATVDGQNDNQSDQDQSDQPDTSGLEDQLNQLDDLEDQLNSAQHDDLAHYASPYYDPAKAHEYYMKNRQLKGKSKLNQAGKEALTQVKKKLSDERDKKISQKTDSTDQKIAKEQTATQKKIDSLRMSIDGLKGLSGQQLERKQNEIRAQIAELRDKTSKTIQSLKADRSMTNANTRQEYKSKIEGEESKIRSDKSFQYVKKAKSSSRRKSSGTKRSSGSTGRSRKKKTKEQKPISKAVEELLKPLA